MFMKLSNRDAFGYPLKFRSAKEAELIGFAPPSADDLLAWWKVDSLTLNDDDSVSSWNDSSDNGNTLAQATGAQQPVYKTNIVNGNAAVLFDGNDAMLANVDITGYGSLSFVMVSRAIVSHAQNRVIGSNFAGNGIRWSFGRGTHSSWGYAQVGSASQYNLGADPTWNSWTSRIITYDQATWNFYDNAYNSPDKTQNDTSYPNNNTFNFVMGAETVATGQYGMNGYIAEILFYGKVLSYSDREAIFNYLNEKYALTA